MDELGAAVGVTGPALYHYFPGKAQLLADMLLPSSTWLAEEAAGIVNGPLDAHGVLRQLVQLHVEFVVSHPSLAVVYARELRNLTSSQQERVRAMMRAYLSTWSEAVSQASPCLDLPAARALLHGVFAMINGVPLGQLPGAGRDVSAFLTTMTVGCLSGFVPGLTPRPAIADHDTGSRP